MPFYTFWHDFSSIEADGWKKNLLLLGGAPSPLSCARGVFRVGVFRFSLFFRPRKSGKPRGASQDGGRVSLGEAQVYLKPIRGVAGRRQTGLFRGASHERDFYMFVLLVFIVCFLQSRNILQMLFFRDQDDGADGGCRQHQKGRDLLWVLFSFFWSLSLDETFFVAFWGVSSYLFKLQHFFAAHFRWTVVCGKTNVGKIRLINCSSWLGKFSFAG